MTIKELLHGNGAEEQHRILAVADRLFSSREREPNISASVS